MERSRVLALVFRSTAVLGLPSALHSFPVDNNQLDVVAEFRLLDLII
jgi:hypothetical protein